MVLLLTYQVAKSVGVDGRNLEEKFVYDVFNSKLRCKVEYFCRLLKGSFVDMQ